MHLSPHIRSLVLEKLGFTADPALDFEGLSALYRRWCDTVPFDNAAKLVAIRRNPAPNLPGLNANQFFTNYLEHGYSGTCWPSSNALFALVSDMGFDARRVAGSMRDTGIISHGSTAVRVDGTDWLVDSSMLTATPLPLRDELFIGDDPLFAAEVEYLDGTHVVWWDSIAIPEYMPCRLTMYDAGHQFYVERYEASREKSGFNERIYVRRNRPDSILVISGNRRFEKTSEGVKASVLSREELEQRLCEEAGFSSTVIDMLRDCGAIAASLIPPADPPSPITGIRPSKRAT